MRTRAKTLSRVAPGAAEALDGRPSRAGSRPTKEDASGPAHMGRPNKGP